LNHGVTEPILGVKIEELKKYQRQIKKDYALSKELFDTGIYDVMYLASLIADETKMTAADLENWMSKAKCEAVADFCVAWVAAEGPHGWELGLEWIESDDETVASAGWSALSGLVSVRSDVDLDVAALRGLLKRVGKSIHQQPDRVRYHMNSFVIAVGAYVVPVHDEAVETAKAIGKVSVCMGNTSCKVPFAPDYIQKIVDRGTIGKKRKMVRC
jgi:hypothetical protein